MKKVLLICILILSFFMSVQAKRNPDSLKVILKSEKSDTTKYNICIAIGHNYQYLMVDSAIIYHKQALKIARKLNDPFRLANSFRELGWDYYLSGKTKTALKYYDSALKNIKKTSRKDPKKDYKNIQLEGFINSHAGIVYQIQSNLPEALDHYFKAIRLQEKIENKRELGMDYTNIGTIYIIIPK